MPVRVKRGHIGRHDIVQVTQPVKIDVQDPNVGSQAGRDLGRVRAHNAAPRMTTSAGATPGTPRKQNSPTLLRPLEKLRPSWMLIRPATSLIGVKSGKPPRASRAASRKRSPSRRCR